jgi:ligand-binding sensor domain-containing protein/signal transduction histidine kinase
MLLDLQRNITFEGTCGGIKQQRLCCNGRIGPSQVRRVLFLAAVLFCCAACSKSKREIDWSLKQDSLVPPHITQLANLPDSAKPKVVLLKNVPKPVTVTPPRRINVTTRARINSQSNPIKEQGSLAPKNSGLNGKANFTTFSSDDGLASDNIYFGFKDKTGTLWFGTGGSGVSRYDGQSFTNFSDATGLNPLSVTYIEEDKNGDLWFVAYGSVIRYNGRDFATFTPSQTFMKYWVNVIKADSKGNLWFGTSNGGAIRYDGKLHTNFSTEHGLGDNNVLSIAEDKKGNLWFGTGKGVSRYDGHSFTTFSTDNGLANNTINSIAVDKEGNLWFATQKGVSRYDGHSFTTFSTDHGLANNTINSIAVDKVGNLWFATQKGISRYDGHLFTTFSTDHGLANNVVYSITEDNAGNLWFGTEGGGLSRYNGQSFTTFSTKQGLADNIVWGIAEDKKGNLWFSTENGGVSCYDRKSFTNFSTEQGLAHNSVYCTTEDKNGNLWFATNGGGVSRYNGQSFTTFSTKQGLADNSVTDIVEDKIGNLWFGTSNGVSRYDGQTFTNFSTAQGLGHNYVYCILEDEAGILWLGTDNGVSRYDGQTITNFTTAQGLAAKHVFSMYADITGNLWFGSGGEGVSVLTSKKHDEVNQNPNTYKTNLFENFTVADGLPDNVVTSMVEADSGKMYLGTNLGICELAPSTLSAKGWVVVRTYNSKTGYPVKDVNTGKKSMFKDSQGIIWIATGSDKTALVRFDPNALIKDTTRAKLVIQQIKINDENICWSDLLKDNSLGDGLHVESTKNVFNKVEQVTTFGRLLSDKERVEMQQKFNSIRFSGVSKWYFLPENLVLPYSNNTISFRFNAIETSKNFLMMYQYMLEGYDNDWTPLSNKTTASFSYLSEGTYTFKLKSRNHEGVWSTPIAFTFSVLPPWWRTWWMYAIYVGLAGSIFFGIIKVREQKLKGEKLILEETVALRTKQLDARNRLVGEQNVELQKMNATKDKFFSIIAHDLKGPLNSLTGFSNLLIGHIDKLSKEEIKHLALDFEKTLKNVSLLLENLLDWSRSQSGKINFTPEVFNVTKVLQQNSELLNGQAKNKNIRIESVLPDEPVEVKAHKQSINTVIRNLISNAIKFTPNGGLITLGIQLKNEEVVVWVKDNGVGMNAEVTQKLFRLGVKHSTKGTANEIGTGLGLLLCKEFVEKNGGQIWVESVEGEGSLFQFTCLLNKTSA